MQLADCLFREDSLPDICGMEQEFIRWLREKLPSHPSTLVGPGDDAAILRLAENHPCVASVDLLTDGVDFELARTSPARVGRKALAVNLSDMAAMAARPLAALLALALPRAGALDLARQLYEGMMPLAEQFHVAVAGGDTNCWDGPLVVSVTILGEPTVAGPLLRSGAKPGDWILVSGRFGGSILGHHFDFQPRVDEALWLAQRWPLHAGIDVSDGLSLDLSRVAQASRCGANLDVHRVPIAEAAVELAAQLNDGSTPLDHALSDGEDFELLLAVAPEPAAELLARQPLDCGLACVGQFVAESGLWQRDVAGNRTPLAARGWEH